MVGEWMRWGCERGRVREDSWREEGAAGASSCSCRNIAAGQSSGGGEGGQGAHSLVDEGDGSRSPGRVGWVGGGWWFCRYALCRYHHRQALI